MRAVAHISKHTKHSAQIAALLILGGFGVFSGCTTSQPTPAPAVSAPVDELPPNKLSALMKADGLISDGIDDKEKAAKLKADGKDQEADVLMKQGEEKVLKGQSDKEAAMKLAE